MPAPTPGQAVPYGLSIEHRTTVDSVAAALREAVLNGQIPPGTPLREVSLSQEAGVSRNTIREAARILESEGLISRQPNRGVVVTDLTDHDIDDLYAARLTAESAGVESLFDSRDERIYAQLAALVDQLEAASAAGDVEAALESDRHFHATLVKATGSGRIERWHAGLQQELRLALSLAERASAELGRQGDDHRELLDALRGRSRTVAREALQRHLATGAAELHRLRALITSRPIKH